MKKKEKEPILPPLPLSPEGFPAGIIRTDPQGSYTGRPADPYEIPVQDADDL